MKWKIFERTWSLHSQRGSTYTKILLPEHFVSSNFEQVSHEMQRMYVSDLSIYNMEVVLTSIL